MKKIEQFAAENNLTIVKINYHSHGKTLKRKGYDLIDSDRRIFASFEPKFYRDYKWVLRNGKSNTGQIHFARLTKKVLSGLVWSEYPSKLR